MSRQWRQETFNCFKFSGSGSSKIGDTSQRSQLFKVFAYFLIGYVFHYKIWTVFYIWYLKKMNKQNLFYRSLFIIIKRWKYFVYKIENEKFIWLIIVIYCNCTFSINCLKIIYDNIKKRCINVKYVHPIEWKKIFLLTAVIFGLHNKVIVNINYDSSDASHL